MRQKSRNVLWRSWKPGSAKAMNNMTKPETKFRNGRRNWTRQKHRWSRRLLRSTGMPHIFRKHRKQRITVHRVLTGLVMPCSRQKKQRTLLVIWSGRILRSRLRRRFRMFFQKSVPEHMKVPRSCKRQKTRSKPARTLPEKLCRITRRHWKMSIRTIMVTDSMISQRRCRRLCRTSGNWIKGIFRTWQKVQLHCVIHSTWIWTKASVVLRVWCISSTWRQ